MGVDTSIYANMLRPPKSVQEYDNERIAQQQNQLALSLGQQKADEYTRSVADANRLRGVVSGFTDDPIANQQALLRSGHLSEANAYAKSNADLGKTNADIGHVKAQTGKLDMEAIGLASQQHKDALGNINDPESAKAWVASAYSDPRLAPISSQGGSLEQAIARIPTDPQAFQQWKLQSSLGADKLIEYTRANANTEANNRQSDINSRRTEASSRYATSSAAATAAAGRAQADRHFTTTQTAGKIPAGYRANPDGSMSFIPGGPADPNAAGGGKMTEDQGKATGWLVQAENGFANMKDAIKNNKSASRPGFNDALANVPSFGAAGALANAMRGEDRQKFIQGASSLSESLLRAATGAGVNAAEAEQKIRELTPVAGDSDAVISQKMASIPLYIESLKVRAGPGSSKAAKVLQTRGAQASQHPPEIESLLKKYGQ